MELRTAKFKGRAAIFNAAGCGSIRRYAALDSGSQDPRIDQRPRERYVKLLEGWLP
jgi:hypothetical protein